MSRTVLFGAPENGDFDELCEFPNSWGGAAYVWTALSAKYLGSPYAWMSGKDEETWSLAEDSRLTDTEKTVLISTFDRALVDRPNFGRLAKAFRDFVAAFPPGNKACNLLKQADLLESLPEEVSVVGWQQTTVAENLWWVHTGEDEGRTYNLSRDSGHFFIFDQKEAAKVP